MVFTARKVTLNSGEEKWTDPEALDFNSTEYSCMHPTVTGDGQKLFFASDQAGGYGGMDLYMCDKTILGWSKPVNLGPKVNTGGDEVFPFITAKGDLYFASNGHLGIGGLDVFRSKKIKGGGFNQASNLGYPINSEMDDFGFILDVNEEDGYFSSNRAKKKDGIFYFEYNMPIVQDFYQQELYFCYSLEEAEMEETDSLKFKWDLGNGEEANGNKIDYCYSDTGTYEVSMSILDKYTGTLFEGVSSYEIIIDAFNKPVIDLEDIKPGVVKVFVNKKWTNLNYTDMYWLVEGNYVFENDLTLKFKNKTELNVKLVVWDREKPGSEIGIERVVYK